MSTNIVKTIRSIDVQEWHPTSEVLSIGLHPWYLTRENASVKLQQLKALASLPNIWAIGECGLDKIVTVDFDLQRQYFQLQIDLANQLGKPLIIHCVKAYEEVMQTLKKQKVKVPVIFHGFNKKKAMARQLTQAGCYLSFGHALLHSPTVAEALKAIPIDQIFFETDNQAEIDIAQIYKKAANLLNINEELLFLQIEKNVANVFGVEKLIIKAQ